MSTFLGPQYNCFRASLGFIEQDVVVLWEPAAHFGKQQFPSIWVVVLQVIEHCGQSCAISLKRSSVYLGWLGNCGEIQGVDLHSSKPFQENFDLGVTRRKVSTICMIESKWSKIPLPMKHSNNRLLVPAQAQFDFYWGGSVLSSDTPTRCPIQMSVQWKTCMCSSKTCLCSKCSDALEGLQILDLSLLRAQLRGSKCSDALEGLQNRRFAGTVRSQKQSERRQRQRRFSQCLEVGELHRFDHNFFLGAESSNYFFDL